MSGSAEDGGSGSKPKHGTVIGVVEPFDPAPSVQVAVDLLRARRTKHALIGGLALDAWGIPRATKDVDFAVPIGAAEAIGDELRARGHEVRPLRIGGIGVRDESGSIRVDLIDRRFHFGRLFAEAIEEADTSGRLARVASNEVPVVSLEYLLAMKLVSGEPKDDADVRRILQIESLDYRKARALVMDHLGAASANRLDALGREMGRPEVPARRLYKNGDHGDE